MKLIAKTKDGDIYEVKVQRMFPNCNKYKSCCTADKEYWDKIQHKFDGLKIAGLMPVYQPPRRDRVKLEHTKPPEGF